MGPASAPRSIRGIDDDVWRRFRARAAAEGRPVGDLLNEVMRQHLRRSTGPAVADAYSYLF